MLCAGFVNMVNTKDYGNTNLLFLSEYMHSKDRSIIDLTF